MGVVAHTSELKALRALFAAPEKLVGQMCVAAAGESKMLVQMGFRNETDPDGNPWKPLKSRKGMILRKTARMANSFTSEATPTGFRVGSNDEKVTFHQEGTKGHKASQRTQAVSGEGKFVRSSGKARARGGVGRTIIRNGRTINILAKKKLTYRGVTGHRALNFKAGGGAIPIRRMVPDGGNLTPRWQQSIDKVCNSVMWKEIAQAGGKP